MMDLSKKDIFEHALKEMPRESCGLLLTLANGKERYFPCANISNEIEHFTINPRDYLRAKELGTITAIVHSHPYRPAEPSDVDRVSCERTGLPWHIVSVPHGIFAYLEPSGYEAPYIGRTWCHGTLDCYALVRDWYKREMNIDLPEFQRTEEWWNHGKNYYVENFEKNGFVRIEKKDMQYGDGLLIQHGSDVPNHAAIYIGKVHNQDTILHHVYGRNSYSCTYGGYWEKHTTHVLRYKGNG